MDSERIHRAKSKDGTEIVGRVEGHGPPLVLVHGSLEDGDLCWQAMLPDLRQHFTCYLPSTRSRGLSGASDDLTPQRRVEDIVSFIASVGEPVRLFGESDGATLTLAAAAQSKGVAAVGVYEPVAFEVADQNLMAALEATLGRVGDAVSDGRTTDAARIFCELVANDDELSELARSSYLDEAARYLPVMLEELQQERQSTGATGTDTSLLHQITEPTLVMYGQRTALDDFFPVGARHVADHVSESQLHAVPAAGHFGVAMRPQPIADQLIRFLQDAARPS